MKRINILLFLFYLLVISCTVQAAKPIRKCFLIAYDISTPFVRSVENLNDSLFQHSVITLFQNQKPKSDEEYAPFLSSTDMDFFDPKKDEILFFYFGFPWKYFIYHMDYPENGVELHEKFLNNFFQRNGKQWSDSNLGSVEAYLKECFANPLPLFNNPSPMGSMNTGITLSNFVYPLIMTRIPSDIYAEEYYLLILSDFLTGSINGNKKDAEKLRQVMNVGNTTRGNDIINNLDIPLRSKFYTINYFDFVYNVNNDLNKNISIIGYKVKPLIGKTSSEDCVFMIDSDVDIAQKQYGSDNYKFSPIQFKFTHKEDFEIDSLVESITVLDSKGKTLNSFSIPFRKDEHKIEYNAAQSSYTLPSLEYKLDKAVRIENAHTISMDFRFFGRYILPVLNNKTINYVFTATRNVPSNKIIFAAPPPPPKLEKNFSILIISVLIFLIMLCILMYRGTIANIKVKVEGFVERFKEIRECQVLEHDYVGWRKDVQRERFKVVFTLLPLKKICKIPCHYAIAVKLTVVADFNTFSLTVVDIENNKKYPVNEWLHLTHADFKKIDEHSIYVEISAINEPDFNINRYFFKVKVEMQFIPFYFGIHGKTKDVETDYAFEVGELLGNLWLGIDPGTNGSSVAFGVKPKDIHISKRIENDGSLKKITHSMLLFDKENFFNKRFEDLIPGEDYTYGTDAWINRRYQATKFRSIKKLLGYDNPCPIVLGKRDRTMTGKELGALLVKGLYKDLESYVNTTEMGLGFLSASEKKELMEDGSFSPKRAVVAVPNNFTLRKIQDMVDSISVLHQFKEIVYTYETEAVLYYYIARTKKEILSGKRVLIFDMGGATINASIFDVDITEDKKEIPVYNVETVGRIGYSIGGDTIDYVLIEIILGMSEVRSALQLHKDEYVKKYRNEHVDELLELSFTLKLQIIENYKEGRDYLIAATALEDLLYDCLHIKVSLANSKEYLSFVKRQLQENDSSLFGLFEMNELVDTIYNNIIDSIDELLSFVEYDNEKEMFVILSGRSITFPYVSDCVEKGLQKDKWDVHRSKRQNEIQNELFKLQEEKRRKETELQMLEHAEIMFQRSLYDKSRGLEDKKLWVAQEYSDDVGKEKINFADMEKELWKLRKKIAAIKEEKSDMKYQIHTISSGINMFEMKLHGVDIMDLSRRRYAGPIHFISLQEIAKSSGLSDMKKYSVDNLKTVVAEGACWYGMNISNVKVHSSKTFYTYCVQHSKDACDTSIISLIRPGESFADNGNISAIKTVNGHFQYDNYTARFYQIIGRNPLETMQKRIKHKIIPIASITEISSEFRSVAMQLNTNDEVLCKASFDGREPIEKRGNSDTKDIVDENEEHYLFAVLHDEVIK